MPLVPGQCPNCNGKLTVDDASRAAVCEYCHTPFVVEDAINQYVSNYSYNIGTVQQMTVQDSSSVDALIQSGEAALRVQAWDKAESFFKKATDKDYGNAEAWFGIVRAKTNELRAPLEESAFRSAESAFNNAVAFAVEPRKGQMTQAWHSWRNGHAKQLSDLVQQQQQTLSTNNLHLSVASSEHEKASAALQASQNYLQECQQRVQSERNDLPAYLAKTDKRRKRGIRFIVLAIAAAAASEFGLLWWLYGLLDPKLPRDYNLDPVIAKPVYAEHRIWWVALGALGLLLVVIAVIGKKNRQQRLSQAEAMQQQARDGLVAARQHCDSKLAEKQKAERNVEAATRSLETSQHMLSVYSHA